MGFLWIKSLSFINSQNNTSGEMDEVKFTSRQQPVYKQNFAESSMLKV